MAEAREGADWQRSAQVTCLLYNAHRDPKKSRYRGPEEFMPAAYVRKEKPEIVPVSTLRDVFLKGKKRK